MAALQGPIGSMVGGRTSDNPQRELCDAYIVSHNKHIAFSSITVEDELQTVCSSCKACRELGELSDYKTVWSPNLTSSPTTHLRSTVFTGHRSCPLRTFP